MYWSLTPQSLLNAGSLALLASHATCSPMVMSSELMDLASPALIEGRQDLSIPPHFDQELITYTDEDGTVISFTHYSGVDIIVDTDVTFHLTPSLSSALRLENNFCTVTNTTSPSRKRFTPNQSTPVFNADGTVTLLGDPIYEIDINECFKTKVSFGIERALRDGLYLLVPTTKQAKKLVTAINNSFNYLVDDIAAWLETKAGFKWVSEVQRRATAAIAIANELGITVADLAGGVAFTGDKVKIPGSNWYMTGNNTKLDCPDPKNWEKEHLVCQTSVCNGDLSTYRCKSTQYSECFCIPRVSVDTAQQISVDFMERQSAAIAAAKDRNAQPVCNGLGSPLFLPRDQAAAEVEYFCKGGIRTEVENSKHPQLSETLLNFTSKRTSPLVLITAPLTEDDCTKSLLKIIDNCDGNSPDNPSNLKHGGSIAIKGWALYLTPVKRQNPFCNRDQLGTKNWVDRDVAIAATKDLCNTPGLLNGKSGARFQNNANQGQNTAVYVSILFTRQSPMTFDDCMRQMSIPIDSCDGNIDPSANPGRVSVLPGAKFGGHFVADNGAVINVTPLVVPPTYPPSGKDTNGNPQQAICGIRGSPKANHDTIDAGINQFCVTNNFLGVGSMKEEHGKNYAHVGGRELTPDEANSAYQDGATACKHVGTWQGRINADDCKFAMYQMRDKCYTSGTGIDAWFTYRCVRWTMVVNEFA